jgi:hypothetical protein
MKFQNFMQALTRCISVISSLLRPEELYCDQIKRLHNSPVLSQSRINPYAIPFWHSTQQERPWRCQEALGYVWGSIGERTIATDAKANKVTSFGSTLSLLSRIVYSDGLPFCHAVLLICTKLLLLLGAWHSCQTTTSSRNSLTQADSCRMKQ